MSSPIEYLKGVGPLRGDLLKKELNIFTFGDLLEHFPYRHLDKTKITPIAQVNMSMDYVQVAGRLTDFEIIGERKGKRLVAHIRDSSGSMELTWFQGINWVQKMMAIGEEFLVFGKLGFFMGKPQIVHPELEVRTQANAVGKSLLEPIYPTTEKLKVRGLNGRSIAKLTAVLLPQIHVKDLPENLPESIIKELKLPSRYEAYCHIHFPSEQSQFDNALRRLKFEELFFAQLRMGMIKGNRHRFSKGIVFDKVGDIFNDFYNHHLPFQLTGAQKRVLKEIRQDTARGHQMNRLLQGDVGSGKTIVALLTMLLAADNGYQSCLMAPTEILAQQHFNSLSNLLKEMNVSIRLLTGSTKKAEREKILNGLQSGDIQLLVGTHALIEGVVQFKNLGLAIVDEQHRFGVAQRAELQTKATIPPHVLVMTATPIPRTMAMTAYGDLDYSVMDELPPGRKPITTVHRYETARPSIMDFVKQEIAKGRQAYFIYPLIEESSKLDFENLMKGYEEVKAFFPEPAYYISMVHGKQKPEVKDTNMMRFKTNDTQIMVATTVIEVGVDVPNASVMVMESAERFGLSQLHQLRGRVGRGSEQSFCILLTGQKLTNDARERLKIMCATNDGFLIAEKDLELRGPGDIEGTRQSGMLNFKLASIVQDKDLLEIAKNLSDRLLQDDPDLSSAENLLLKSYLLLKKGKTEWSRVA
ncbi:ATP-dependent DNA helicase RecG [Lacibacter sp.]|uniref:ATP-dependent DNA helicase RecG n=1 Tax=Lacibacter sp. TaxID=1915409 RepID=UPI002B4AEFC6|nr:ATP-dependent DNA helicase RecG [Lacibacter sp.]HLP36456.1 ATP-dependent DNA helicase RecG [Lacibacter sp.]